MSFVKHINKDDYVIVNNTIRTRGKIGGNQDYIEICRKCLKHMKPHHECVPFLCPICHIRNRPGHVCAHLLIPSINCFQDLGHRSDSSTFALYKIECFPQERFLEALRYVYYNTYVDVKFDQKALDFSCVDGFTYWFPRHLSNYKTDARMRTNDDKLKMGSRVYVQFDTGSWVSIFFEMLTPLSYRLWRVKPFDDSVTKWVLFDQSNYRHAYCTSECIE